MMRKLSSSSSSLRPARIVVVADRRRTHVLIVLMMLLQFARVGGVVRWDNDVRLDENFRMLWTVDVALGQVTFEVQANTLGYVGLGFSPNGELPGSDVAIGWVHQGQAYFQDRYVKNDGGTDVEPVVDPSQDYVLISGHENATHTVLRFRRNLDTCDTLYDVPITNDTMRVIYMYHQLEPVRGSITAGNLPDPAGAYRGYRSLFLTQTPTQATELADSFTDPMKMAASAGGVLDFEAETATTTTLELRNVDVVLPSGDDTLYWCKMFKLADIEQKSHVIKYEPVFDSPTSRPYMQHIILYECQPSSVSSAELELMSREPGRPCNRPNAPPLSCNAIVATWARGSEGFAFPPEAGYALDTDQARFYLMETHYSHPASDNNAVDGIRQDNDATQTRADNSGLRLFYTSRLRPNDAGVLSIGIDPNWRHIIPPFQPSVVSSGHCFDGCTRRAFPRSGIAIFAVMMRTHLIGREIRLRHQRRHEEFAPVAHDRNVDPDYQEYRRLADVRRAMPGDRLIAECTYDSSRRDQITLGGPTRREEACIVLTYYYPRQKRLTTCHSLPSLPTVLHSLGIQELAIGSNPVLIASPPELAGMTLESRLVTYDWRNQFEAFQQATQHGSFKAICWDARNALMHGTESIEGHNLNITKSWSPPVSHCSLDRSSDEATSSVLGGSTRMEATATLRTNSKHRSSRPSGSSGNIAGRSSSSTDNDADAKDDSTNAIDGASLVKVSRGSPPIETVGLSGAAAECGRPAMMVSSLVGVVISTLLMSGRCVVTL